MPPRSLTGLGPQPQLGAPNSEPLTMLTQNSQAPMVKYERQLAVDEGYPSTLDKYRFPLNCFHHPQ